MMSQQDKNRSPRQLAGVLRNELRLVSKGRIERITKNTEIGLHVEEENVSLVWGNGFHDFDRN